MQQTKNIYRDNEAKGSHLRNRGKGCGLPTTANTGNSGNERQVQKHTRESPVEQSGKTTKKKNNNARTENRKIRVQDITGKNQASLGYKNQTHILKKGGSSTTHKAGHSEMEARRRVQTRT